MAISGDYCPKCDHDDHRCAGCGEPIEHGRVDCDDCRAIEYENEIVLAVIEQWQEMSPVGDAASILRAVDKSTLTSLDNLARVATLAAVKRLNKLTRLASIQSGVRDAAEGRIKRLDWVTETDDDERIAIRYAADAVVFATVDDVRYVLLIRRGGQPHEGKLALPGGHVEAEENTLMACTRGLTEETGLVLTTSQFRRLSVYDEPHRDPRGRYVSVAYVADLGNLIYLPGLTAGDDASEVVWMPVPDVLGDADSMVNAMATGKVNNNYRDGALLAFDHWAMVSDGLSELGTATVGVRMWPAGRGEVWATKDNDEKTEVTEP